MSVRFPDFAWRGSNLPALQIGSVLAWLLSAGIALAQNPPFSGTVYVDRDIIRPDDWSAYQSLSYVGIAPRFVFDRRDDAFSTKPMHIFNATYADGLPIEVQVNSNDFSIGPAETYAIRYAAQVGRLPTSLRADVAMLAIHAGGGSLPWGGGNNAILIHVDIDLAILDFEEEILFHEAAHATYGPDHDSAPAWQAAQAADPTFISDYAREHPTREDVAETLLMWYAVRYRSDRLDAATIAATEAAIPNRLAYFDALPFQLAMPIGDFNGDNSVDAADLASLKSGFGTTGSATRSQGDADGDRDVDGADFLTWQRQLGAGGSSLVPEPQSVALVVCALAFCYRRFRKASRRSIRSTRAALPAANGFVSVYWRLSPSLITTGTFLASANSRSFGSAASKKLDFGIVSTDPFRRWN